MSKCKILKLATLAAGLVLGGTASAAGGDIYEIRPCLRGMQIGLKRRLHPAAVREAVLAQKGGKRLHEKHAAGQKRGQKRKTFHALRAHQFVNDEFGQNRERKRRERTRQLCKDFFDDIPLIVFPAVTDKKLETAEHNLFLL